MISRDNGKEKENKYYVLLSAKDMDDANKKGSGIHETGASRYETGRYCKDKDFRLDIINRKPSAHAEVP